VKLRREKALNLVQQHSGSYNGVRQFMPPPLSPPKNKLSLNWNIPHSPDLALSKIKVHLQGVIFQDIEGTENCEVGTACYSQT
jgi:hypothetical protein